MKNEPSNNNSNSNSGSASQSCQSVGVLGVCLCRALQSCPAQVRECSEAGVLVCRGATHLDRRRRFPMCASTRSRDGFPSAPSTDGRPQRVLNPSLSEPRRAERVGCVLSHL